MKNLRPWFLAMTINYPAPIANVTNLNGSCRPAALRAEGVLHLLPAHHRVLPVQAQIAAVAIKSLT